ncbi:helix-turn-helix domain-containing protein [Streptomyces sp. NPDC017615]|uniref:helix-turn-helix domain-containing protein n=1 Tax=Streptomyces sp. NPDC017615 TaxID=3365003 RepID=UPI00379F9070
MSSNEPEAAEYQRKDMSQAPESPLGQQAAIEGALAAKGQPPNDEPRIWTLRDMKAMKNRSRLEATTALKTLYVQMLAEIENSEAERRAAVIAAGGDPDEDRDPLEFVHAIADEWAASDADAERRAELLDNLADRLDTREVRALRLAAEAAKAITPRLIAYDAAHGVSPAQIAEDLGVTESYVYRMLRQYTRYAWRLDLWNSEQGPGWQPHKSGEEFVERVRVSEGDVAAKVISEGGESLKRHRHRVLVWEGEQRADELAYFTHENSPATAGQDPEETNDNFGNEK